MPEERVVRYVITGNPTGAISAFGRTAKAADATANSIEKTGKRMKSLGSGMVSAGHMLSRLSIPLIAVGGYAIKSAMDFQSSMTMLKTQAGASAKEVTNLSSAVLKLGPKVAESPEELAKALYPIRSVGLSGAHAMSALTAAAKGAQVSGAGLTEVAEAMSGAMRTQMSDVHSAAGAMGIMNGIVGLGKMHLADLTGAMTTGILPAAKNVGLGFRDVGAALDAMTRQGVPAEAEATRLRTNLTKMVAPTGAALRALRRIGLEQFSLANDMRKPNGLVTALRDLHEHLSRVSKNEQELVIAQAFGGAKGSSNVVGLLNALPEMEHIRGELNRYGEKQLNQAFGTRSQDAAFKMQRALDAVKSSLITLGQTIMPVVVPAMQKIAQAAQHFFEWFSRVPKPVRDATVYFGMFLAVGGPLLIFFGTIFKAVGSLVTVLGKLGPAVEAAQGDMVAQTGSFASIGTKFGNVMGAAMGAAMLAYVIYEAPKIGTWLEKEVDKVFHINPRSPTGKAVTHVKHNVFDPFGWTEGVKAAFTGELEHNLAVNTAGLLGFGGKGNRGGGNGYGQKQKRELATAKAENIRELEKEAREARQALQAPIIIHNHVELDGNVVTHSVTKRIRNNPQHAKPVAEGVNRYAQTKAARGG